MVAWLKKKNKSEASIQGEKISEFLTQQQDHRLLFLHIHWINHLSCLGIIHRTLHCDGTVMAVAGIVAGQLQKSVSHLAFQTKKKNEKAQPRSRHAKSISAVKQN